MARGKSRLRSQLGLGLGLSSGLGLGLGGLGCGPAPSDETQAEGGAAATELRTLDLDPPEDRRRAPYTGWTRAHYEAVFARLVLGFVDHRSPAGARTRYPGGEQLPAAMEGAIRMLPALGAWLACPCNPERVQVDGRELDITAIATAIVVAGTDPRSRDYWHPIGKGWDQRKVEAATVAEFLLRSRARVWDRLDLVERALILRWLRPTDEPLAANWLAFQIARNTARVELGAGIDEADLAEQLDRLEADYAGDGFYRDGGEHRFDWYNALVIHPQLSLWRASAAGRDRANPADAADRARVARVAERTRAFLGHLPYLFEPGGAVAPIGRSLAYRAGVLAALHASILAEDGFVEPGLARRMSAGNLRMHVEAGMFDADNVLTRGYYGDAPALLERYLRPGSQYYMTHALAPLALAPDHPFWTAPEQPLPAEVGDFVHPIPAVGWLVEYDDDGPGLVLHNTRAGTAKAAYHDRYKKLGYAPRTWYASADGAPRPYDASLVSASAARFESRRSLALDWAVAPGFAWTRYAIAPEGPVSGSLGPGPHRISTAVLTPRPLSRTDVAGPRPSVRLACVFPSAQAPAQAYLGSFAVRGGGTGRGQGSDPTRPWWYLDGESDGEGGAGGTDGVGGVSVLLAGLAGWTRAGPRLDWPGTATHVLGGEASWVGLGLDTPDAGPRCFVSLEQVAPAPFEPEPVLAQAPEVVQLRTTTRLTWAHGAEAFVELAGVAVTRRLTLAGVVVEGPLRMARVEPGADGGAWIVAAGVTHLRDAEGFELRSVEPRTIACELDPPQVRCELDGLVVVRQPGADALDLTWREPLWLGLGGLGPTSEPAATRVEADVNGWIRLEPPASASTVSVAQLRFETD